MTNRVVTTLDHIHNFHNGFHFILLHDRNCGCLICIHTTPHVSMYRLETVFFSYGTIMKAKPSTVLCTCKHAYIHTCIHTRLHKCMYVKRMFIFIIIYVVGVLHRILIRLHKPLVLQAQLVSRCYIGCSVG